MIFIDNTIILEKTNGTDGQIRGLYDMLIKRTYNISNTTLLSIEENIYFAQDHPYRTWYLIRDYSNYIGTACLMMSNCVGINLIANFKMFSKIIEKY